jgi:beta-glucosidase-like glycosyl hydrolase
MTDALEMRALEQIPISPERRGIAALQAGADLLLFEGDLTLIEASVGAIAEALEVGELKGRDLAPGAARLAAARDSLAAHGRPPNIDVVGSPAHRAVSMRQAVAGMRVSGRPMLPLDSTPWVLDRALGRHVADVLGWPLLEQPAPGSSPVVVAVEDAEIDASTRAAMESLRGDGTEVVLVVLGGWQPPSDVAADVVVQALDLPHGLWPAIGERIHPHQANGRRGIPG